MSVRAQEPRERQISVIISKRVFGGGRGHHHHHVCTSEISSDNEQRIKMDHIVVDGKRKINVKGKENNVFYIRHTMLSGSH